MAEALRAPFPYFGGKRFVTDVVWDRLGAGCAAYCEPFAGSLAVLLARPGGAFGREVVNDIDGMVVNFWRAVRAEPATVASYTDWPITELDLHARHQWLADQKSNLTEQLRADPTWYDAQVAGWWCWGANLWIGHGWCRDAMQWQQYPNLTHRDRRLAKSVKLPEVVDPPIKLVQSGVAPFPAHSYWLTSPERADGEIVGHLRRLAERLRPVVVLCGDWTRGIDAVARGHGQVAIFLDPPYAPTLRERRLYGHEDDDGLSAKVRAWAIERGNNRRYRIALCGYATEHPDDWPDGWTAHRWTRHGGLANQNRNGNPRRFQEVVWFSPHCVPAKQLALFDSRWPRSSATMLP